MAAAYAIRLTRSIEIARPPEAVFERVVDFERMHEWFYGVRQVSILSPELEAGAERRLTLVLGVSHLERIAEWNPPKSFAIRVLDPPLFTRRWDASIRFDSGEGSATAILWEMRWEPRFGWLGRVFNAWLVRPVVGMALARSLRRLKRVMEAEHR